MRSRSRPAWSSRARIAASAACESRSRTASSTARWAGTGSSLCGALCTMRSRCARPDSITISMRSRSSLWVAVSSARWKARSASTAWVASVPCSPIASRAPSRAARSASVRRSAARRTAAGSMIARTSARLCSSARSDSDVEAPSNCQRRTSASRRFHSARGRTKVPRRCRASTIPLAASTLSDSRSAVRLTSNSLCRPTRSSVAPSAISPPRMRRARSSTVWPCTPRRA